MIIKTIVKEIFLCILIGVASVLSIVFIGIIGLPNSVGGKIGFWIFAGVISYSLFIFIPFFEKKKYKYFDGYALATPYLTILVLALFRSEEIDDFEYITLFSFVIGISIVFELLLTYSRKKSVPKKASEDNYEKRIKELFSNEDSFVLLEVVTKLNISEYKARLILVNMEKKGQISFIKDGIKKRYWIKKPK